MAYYRSIVRVGVPCTPDTPSLPEANHFRGEYYSDVWHKYR